MRTTALIAGWAVAQAFGQQTQPSPAEPPSLVGLWGAHPVFGPALQGEVTVRREGASWSIQIGGREFLVPPPRDGAFHWKLPEGLGALRGRQTPTGLKGFWIQPPSEGPAYATPVRFGILGPGAWRGVVAPLLEKLSLYLDITDADSVLHGTFHNPEMRWNGGSPWFKVVPEGESLKLIDPVTGKVRFTQALDPGQRRISMDFGTPFALVPLTPAQAPGFRPRVTAPSYTYRVPVALGDGWKPATPQDAGLDRQKLEALVAEILAVDPTRGPGPRIHSVLVAKHGKLVLEEYFFGFQASDRHDLRSASKSLTSLLVGAALDRHPEVRVDAPLERFFGPFAGKDTRKGGITLAHALTHTTGLAADDNDGGSPGGEDRLQRTRGDWYRFMLDLPLAHAPGTHYAYSSGGINLALGAAAHLTGQWMPAFFDETFARPMGIHHYHMNLMPDGEAYGGGGIHLRPRDLLKFGQLILQEGAWEGRQLVSRAWIKASTSHQVDTPEGGSDGYGWHRHRLSAGGRTVELIEANGNGGQFLIIVPSQRLVVVFTAGNYNQYGIWRTFRERLLPAYALATP